MEYCVDVEHLGLTGRLRCNLDVRTVAVARFGALGCAVFVPGLQFYWDEKERGETHVPAQTPSALPPEAATNIPGFCQRTMTAYTPSPSCDIVISFSDCKTTLAPLRGEEKHLKLVWHCEWQRLRPRLKRVEADAGRRSRQKTEAQEVRRWVRPARKLRQDVLRHATDFLGIRRLRFSLLVDKRRSCKRIASGTETSRHGYKAVFVKRALLRQDPVIRLANSPHECSVQLLKEADERRGPSKQDNAELQRKIEELELCAATAEAMRQYSELEAGDSSKHILVVLRRSVGIVSLNDSSSMFCSDSHAFMWARKPNSSSLRLANGLAPLDDAPSSDRTINRPSSDAGQFSAKLMSRKRGLWADDLQASLPVLREPHSLAPRDSTREEDANV
ncbi:hypothetical protein C8F01DRAFT_1266704 [Mycena amicta]|nr:hypothetical protein C8F01DRAFT_1266704 [Mycena amicta]